MAAVAAVPTLCIEPPGSRSARAQAALIAADAELQQQTGDPHAHFPVSSTTVPLAATTVDELLAISQPNWLTDLCTLSWAFDDDNADLLYQPAILNPMFAGSADIGGADADLIVDDCLVEIKLTINRRLNDLSSAPGSTNSSGT